MGNLFRGWPRDSLAQVWAHHRFEIDTDICSHHLRLGAHRMPGDSWVPNSVKRHQKLVSRLRVLVRPGIRLNYGSILRWTQQFAPEIIYSQATPYPMYTWWLPRWLARDLRVPLVNHIMDDWPAALDAEWLFPIRWALKPLLSHQLKALFGTAVCNLAISEQMASAFADRYGHGFIPFHNAIDLELWATPKPDYAAHAGEFRVVYLGALAEGMQVLSLRDVALVVSSLAEQGCKISLTVYTGAMYLDCFRQYLGGLPAVSHGGSVARADLCGRLAAADLLVVPVNFDRRSLLLNQYSMPTKVPEYMASGTPILVYAPRHVPPAAYARTEGWGYVVDQPDKNLLRAALIELMASAELRRRLGQRGRELALANHDAVEVRRRFRWVLNEATPRSEHRSR